MKLSLRSLAISCIAPPLIYSLVEPYRLCLRQFDVPMRGLPAKADGWKIVQLSDLHVSALGGAALLQRAVTLSNSLQPDAVFLTGDFISRRNSYASFTGARMWARPLHEYMARMTETIADLNARFGIYAVAGNHDHHHGHCDIIEHLLRQVGIVSLRNKSTFLDDILPLIGLDDLRGGRPLIRQALKEIDPAAPQIILSHNPRLMLALRHRNAFILSGHTHGGQVHLPLTRFRVRPRDVAQTPFLRGWYHQSPAQMYVNSGLGCVHFPMRFRCPPEITVFTLRRV